MSEKLIELKQEADDLGIKYSPNIGEEKLQEKINTYYESQETSSKELMEAVEAKEKKESTKKTVATGKNKMAILAKKLYEEAKKPVVVTIIDNDQRVNNQTTTCKATWGNAYYDMGTQTFPLNIPIQIPQGFVTTLKEVQIPHHIKDPKTGLSISSMRNRYTITYENK
jgi:hypothetical protein